MVFFDSFAPHHSGSNRTDRPRRALYVTYNRLSDGDFRERHYRERSQVISAATERGDQRISTIGHFQGEQTP